MCNRDRVMTWEVPIGQQMQVQPGNVLAVMVPAGGRIMMTACENTSHRMFYYYIGGQISAGFYLDTGSPRCFAIAVNVEVRPL